MAKKRQSGKPAASRPADPPAERVRRMAKASSRAERLARSSAADGSPATPQVIASPSPPIVSSPATEMPVAAGGNERDWPIVRAFVPEFDVWRTTGNGTAGIVRRRPDGLLATAYFHLSLMEDGVAAILGRPDCDAATDEAIRQSFRGHLPPMEEGDPDIAARYIWGAIGLGRDAGRGFEPEQEGPYLALVPPVAGDAQRWVEQLVGQDGLVPMGLMGAVDASLLGKPAPKGREIAILCDATFAIPDATGAIAALRAQSPEFEQDDEEGPRTAGFVYTREYPKNHWSPQSKLGGRQELGSVWIEDENFRASSNALSMLARLIERLRELGVGPMRLTRASWHAQGLPDHFVETFD